MLVPVESVTVTCTVPTEPAGEMAVIWVGESRVKVVAVLPNRTVVKLPNPVPVIVTLVPPVVGPEVGEREVMVGMTASLSPW
nr:hypothetical protein [Nocardia abscessus]